MKSLLRIFFTLCLLLGAASPAWPQGPDASDIFLRAYQEFQTGEKCERDAKTKEALSHYRTTAKLLEQITKSAPTWQPSVVEYRLRKARENIQRLAGEVARTPPAPAGSEGPEGPLPQNDGEINIPLPQISTNVPPSTGTTAPRPTPPRQADYPQNEVTAMRQQLASIRKENQKLQEKLTRQTAELKSALFEVDRTKITVVETRAQLANAQNALENAISDRDAALKKPAKIVRDDRMVKDLTNRIEKIEADNEVLAEENSRLVAKLDAAAKYIRSADEIRLTLESDRQKVARQRDEAVARTKRIKDNIAEIDRLTAEKEALEKAFAKEKKSLQERLEEAANPVVVQRLQEEKKALEEKLAKAPSPETIATLQQEKKALEDKFASAPDPAAFLALQAEKAALEQKLSIAPEPAEFAVLQQEKKALEEKLAAAPDPAAIVQLQEEKKALEEKLAAASDPAEFAKLQEEKKALEEKLAAAPDPAALEAEKKALEEKLAAAPDPAALAKLQEEKKAVDALLANVPDAAEFQRLREEKKALEEKLGALPSPEEIAKLREDKTALEQQLAGMPDRVKILEGEKQDLSTRLAEAEKKLASLPNKPAEKDKALQELRSEIQSLNDRVLETQAQILLRDDQIKSLTAQLDETSGEIARIKLNPTPSPEEAKLLNENQILRGIVLQQIKEHNERDAARIALSKEIETLQVKSDTISQQLEILAKPAFRFSSEQAALFNEPVSIVGEPDPSSLKVNIAIARPSASPSPPASTAKPADALPDSCRTLVDEAKKHFEAGRFADAEKNYRKIVEIAPDNYFALSNLAITQIQSQKYSAAEIALKKAMALKPNDSFAPTHLGIVYCKKGRFDEAIDILRQSLKIDDKSAVTYNYLGVCLGEKGLREESERELLRSVQMRDNYPDAHFNLAVLYATSKPPNIKAGREHYLKALAAGAAPDPALERVFQ